MSKRIKRLFIANRGEICRRIAISAKRMGVETVAMSERNPPPEYLLDVIDRFIPVEEESSALFLDKDGLVAKARDSGCDAVHPGFGFLSENQEFAAAVIDGGLTWVGPHPGAIRDMASKAEARNFADRAKLPSVEALTGFDVPEDENGDFSAVEKFAASTEYPLLVKAVYGGGGKGMRRVNTPEELRESVLRAHSEAINSFGNGALICERYLTSPRHVEVQVLADKHGNAYAIGDRDCSVQRRHQKIIEEAPAPNLSDKTRNAMHDAAVRLALAVGYDSTGTVEFMVDWSDPSRAEQKFYFLEMNTRLQVEHPVSEEVFGIDLVEWQLRVAQGEKLPASFKNLEPRGHAIEARVYAEDTDNNFMPAAGPVRAFIPYQGSGIRWEVGIDTVDEISTRFDPMISKLVVRAADRPAAMRLMCEAIERTFFAGPPANFDLLHMLMSHSDFAEGPVDTHYLVNNLESCREVIKKRFVTNEKLAVELLEKLENHQLGAGAESGLAGISIHDITETAFGAGHGVHSSGNVAGGVTTSLESAWQDTQDESEMTRIGRGLVTDGDGYAKPFWYAAHKDPGGKEFCIQIGGCHYKEEKKASTWADMDAAASEFDVVAPVPGKVIAIKVGEGDTVEVDATLFILESMKMEFEVKAAKTGDIGSIKVEVGQQLTAGDLLASWAEATSSS